MRLTNQIVVVVACWQLVISVYCGTLKDDFNHGQLKGWTHECFQIVGNDLRNLKPCPTKEGDATWRIKRNELIVQTGPITQGSFIAVGEEDWKNYTVSVKAKIVKHQPRQDGGITWFESAALVLRSSSKDSFYFFALGTTGLRPKEVRACVFNNNFNCQNNQSTPFEWKLNKWYQLKVEAKGGRFKYYVDGKQVIDYKDETHPAGKVGIWAGDHSTTFHYDDFMVTGPQVPDLNLSVSSQSKLATVWAQVKSIK